MDFLNDIDWAFLDERFWNIKVSVWLIFLGFVVASFLLKNVITLLFTRVLFRIFKRFFGNYPAEKFKILMTRPVAGLVQWTLLYYAFIQISPQLDKVFLFKSFAKISEEVNSQRIKETVGTSLGDILEKIIYLAFVYFVFLLLLKITEYILSLRLKNAQLNNDKSRQQLIPLLRDISKVVVWFLAGAVALGMLFDLKVGTILGGLGIGGVAIAFAAKESLENLIASFMVLVDKPFMIGDWIKVGNVDGTIEKIGFRSARLRTFDKSVVIIPNRKLIDEYVENYSTRGTRRFKFTIGGIYGVSQENIEKAMDEIKERVAKVPGVVDEIVLWLDGFGDSQLNINMFYFMEVKYEVKFWDVKNQVNFIIYDVMYKYCQGFAFPTQTEHHGGDINELYPTITEEEEDDKFNSTDKKTYKASSQESSEDEDTNKKK